MSSLRTVCQRTALALVAVAATAGASAAHFAMPKSVDFLPRPGHPDDIYLEVTFGLLESHDAGATWQYYCEDPIQGVGYAGMFIPDMAVSAAGTVFSTTIIGLRARRDGCTFDATQFGESFIAQVTVAPDGTVYAAAANGVPPDSTIYKSTDDGVTFAPTAATTPGDEAGWTSLEVAPGDPQRIYVTGYRLVGGTRQVTMYRSDDAGASWVALPTSDFATTTNSDIIVGAISPDDPDLVIARMTHRIAADADAIYRSTNAGQTWTKVHEFDSQALGIVIRTLTGPGPAATKAQVLIGAGPSGVWTSTDGGVTFGKNASTAKLLCLREHGGQLYGCNDSENDSTVMALGSSPDAVDFTSMVKFRDLTGITSCAPGTIVHDQCELVRWCFVRDLYGITADPTNCPSATADAALGPDAGPPAPPPESCCFAGGVSGANGLVGLVALAPWLRRRRRRS